MQDDQIALAKLRRDAAEAALIRDHATDSAKRALFDRLHAHLHQLADDVEKAVSASADCARASASCGEAMDDQWKERLRCPQCKKRVMASLFQDAATDVPTVDDIAEGFSMTLGPDGPIFFCSDCAVEVEPQSVTIPSLALSMRRPKGP